MRNIIDILIQGGFVMIPLGIGSILIGALAVRKFRLFSQFEKDLRDLLSGENKDNMQSKAIELALDKLEKNSALDFNKFQARQVWDFEQALSSGMWIMGSLATLAPFIGLFGTVIGIIKSFASIAEAGKGGFAIVSADLSEALIATAAGIFVAIVASFFYNYFLQRSQKIKKSFAYALDYYHESRL